MRGRGGEGPGGVGENVERGRGREKTKKKIANSETRNSSIIYNSFRRCWGLKTILASVEYIFGLAAATRAADDEPAAAAGRHGHAEQHHQPAGQHHGLFLIFLVCIFSEYSQIDSWNYRINYLVRLVYSNHWIFLYYTSFIHKHYISSLVHISELLILYSLSSRVGWWTPGWCRSSSSRCRRPAAWWPASSSRWSWCPADSRNTQTIIDNKHPTPLATIGRICCFKKSKDPTFSGRITL